MPMLKSLVAKLPLRAACLILIVLPLFFLFFHLFIIFGLLPRDIVWGGRLTDLTFIPLELLALALNMLLMLVGGVAGGFVTSPIAHRLVDQTKWFLFYFVVVNTVLALFSTTTFEQLLTPVTALYAVCLYRINAFADGLGPRP